MKGLRALPVLALAAGVFAQGPTPALRSGYEDMGPALQAMQRDATQNPAALWLAEGRQLWQQASARGQACSGCHGEPERLRGVAVRYPAWSETRQRPITLGQRIALCRQEHQGQADSEGNLALETLVSSMSQGLPIPKVQDARLQPALAEGQRLFQQRLGQLDLSCAQCHDERAGLRLGGSLIPQGHPNGYPLYRLQWQALGPLQRRLRNCLTGVRAEPWPAGHPTWVALELHLMNRAAGLAWEAPAVRP